MRADNQDRLSGDNYPKRRQTLPLSVIAIAVGLALLLVGGYYAYRYFQDRDKMPWLDDPATTTYSDIDGPTSESDAPELEYDPEQLREPAPMMDEDLKREYKLPPEVPTLNDSNADLRAQLEQLDSLQGIVSWSNTEDLARRFVVLVYNLAEGDIAHRYLPLTSPAPFRATGSGNSLRIDPASYARYNQYADAFAAVDAKHAVSIYQFFWPALKRAFAELGEPRKSLHSEGLKAIDHLLQTPELSGDIKLVQPSVYYKYADPTIERLSPAQKQMIRLGPRNRALIKSKLQEIRGLLLSNS